MEYHSGGSLPLLGRPRYCPGAAGTGGYLCETGHCCGDTGCCTYYYELWWFWLLWTVLILLSCCCAYRHRRSKVRVQQQQRQRDISLLAYQGAGSYPSSMLDLSFLSSLKLPSYEEVAAQPVTPPPPYSSVFTSPRYPQPPRCAEPHLLTQHGVLLHRALSDGPSSLSSDNSSSCSCDSCCPSSPCSSSLSAPVTYETDTSHASTPDEATPLTPDVAIETGAAGDTQRKTSGEEDAAGTPEPSVLDSQAGSVAGVTQAASPFCPAPPVGCTCRPRTAHSPGVVGPAPPSIRGPFYGPEAGPTLKSDPSSPTAQTGVPRTRSSLDLVLGSAEPQNARLLPVPVPTTPVQAPGPGLAVSVPSDVGPVDASPGPPNHAHGSGGPCPVLRPPTPPLPCPDPPEPGPGSSRMSDPVPVLAPPPPPAIAIESDPKAPPPSPPPALGSLSLPGPPLLLDPVSALHQSNRGGCFSGHTSSLCPSPRATQSPPKQTLFSPCVDVFEPGPPSWGVEDRPGEGGDHDHDDDDEEDEVGADESQYRRRRLTGDSGIEVCRCRVEEEEEEEEEEGDQMGGADAGLHDSVDCPAHGQVPTAVNLCNPASSAMPSSEDEVVVVMETA
ncbi:WAS/WASL-interacting protein family member 3 [Brachionichthys hirsutus]|uniref:WAS/WASL-interacting protein family member 3 n=1 Tax=Brachionichthys hirsutus TaxID=412623 RepID=UPI003604E93C